MASTSQQQRIIFITGANKGLGFEVVKKLLNDSSSSKKDLILLGSRDLQRGEEALKQLGSPSNVHIVQIDTSSPESIVQAANEIKQKYGGKLDILINNAGIAGDENTVESARKVFATNYYGPKSTVEHFRGFIRENGRIINVASEIGAWTLHDLSKDLQAKYQSSTLTAKQLDQLVEEFISSIGTNTAEQLGYNTKSPFLIYGVSKMALIALTKIEARNWSGAKNVLVLSVCPGYCATDMNKNRPGARPAELGADSILYPATTAANQLENGQFYQDGEKKPQSYACTMDFSAFMKNTNSDQTSQ